MNSNDYKKLICDNFCAHNGELHGDCRNCCLNPTLINCFELRKDAEKLMNQSVLSDGSQLLQNFHARSLDEMEKRFGLKKPTFKFFEAEGEE